MKATHNFTSVQNVKNIVVILDTHDGDLNIFEALELDESRDNLDLIVLSKDLERFQYLYKKNSLVCTIKDFSELEIDRCLQEIKTIRKNIYSITIASRKEKLVYLASKFREKFQITHGLSLEVATRFVDKFLMKQAIIKAGIPTAAMAEAKPEILEEFVGKYGFPIIIKPKRETGSVGVKIVAERKEAFKILKSVKQNDYMVEAFVPGEVYRVDGVIYNGRIKSAKTFKYTPSCYDLYIKRLPQIESIVLDKNELEDIHEITEKSLNALGGNTCVFHLEVIKNPISGLNFLEAAARPGGGSVRKMLRKYFDLDLANEMMRFDIGLPCRTIPDIKKFAWVISIPTPSREGAYLLESITIPTMPKESSLLEIECPAIGSKMVDYDEIVFLFISQNEKNIQRDYEIMMNNIQIKFSKCEEG